ncbi:fumarate hydratase [Thermococcus aggregans]|uniref:Fumarate hydratase n=1 Tax=Thermococcus aggregans TaxID=110163 RepID=A0A9E7SPD2_THEAG|nr:fumarate hydratase [Thermococcus aggregans]USS40722.1 fumarate hydratase [Thermococcus aggregans]
MEDAIIEAIRLAVTKIPDDVVKSLQKAYEKENSPTARFNLENILNAIEIGEKEQIPVCQDTGTVTFFVEAGVRSPYLGVIKELITSALEKATREIPLRPNTVDVLTNKNIGNFPIIHWELVGGDKIKIAVLPKGGGSENCSALAMLTPAEGFEGVKQFVIERVKECGGKPCPPIILGIGIGGSSDLALKLAKKALLRPIGKRHQDEKIARFEEELLEEINSLKIGPMGMGGKTTALDVKVEVAPRHPASFPVGIVFQCWAHRKAFLEINKDGEVRIWQ